MLVNDRALAEYLLKEAPVQLATRKPAQIEHRQGSGKIIKGAARPGY
jgi:hypothetical protein